MQKKMTMEELATRYHNRDTAPRIVGGREIPYIDHPRAVVKRLISWGCSKELTKDGWRVLDIAWGHDLLEDTRVPPEEIAAVAGEEVLRGIELLSNLPGKHPDKAAYIQSRKGTPSIQRRKLAPPHGKVVPKYWTEC